MLQTFNDAQAASWCSLCEAHIALWCSTCNDAVDLDRRLCAATMIGRLLPLSFLVEVILTFQNDEF